jgi:PAS domain S-box-containing protein
VAGTFAVDSEAELRLLVENSTDILSRQSPDGTILSVSPAVTAMLGYEPGEVIGRNKCEFVHGDDLRLMLPALGDPAIGQEQSHFAEYRLRRKDGVYIWVQTTSRLIRGESGKVREIIAVVRDITERKQASDGLRHTERLASIGTLAAGIAHEINNPLGAILMAAYAAREFNRDAGAAGNAARIEEMLNQIMEDARRGAGIVKSVLQFARQEKTEKLPMDLRDILLRARHHAMIYAGKRDVVVKVRGPDESPKVMVNAIEIEQALVNVIHNSIDAGAAKVQVTVRPDETTGRVNVSVTDDGKGMTQSQLKHAFDPFFTSRSNSGGTGLGLSIAQGIVLAHGGAISLTSEPGQGTTIAFDLPLASGGNEGGSHV